MEKDPRQNLIIRCQACGKDNLFDQPYAYHAGFSDVGFLYSDSGHCTLVWSWFDPAFKRFLNGEGPLADDIQARNQFEKSLRAAPDGGRWRFNNPARCLFCSAQIAGPMLSQIYFLVYPDSIITNDGDQLDLNAQLLKL